MPTQSEMRIPIPQSPDEFENICLDYLKFTYPELICQRYGRQGQNQHGIDIYVDSFRKLVQCKRYYVASTTSASQKANELKQKIGNDYQSAKKFFKDFQQFIAMTTFDRDTEIQNHIANLGTDIHVLFWDDIENFLCQNEMIFKKYYPQLYSNNNSAPKINTNTLNKMISISTTLKTYSIYFYKLRNHCPFFNEQIDIQIYNEYVKLYNLVLELLKIHSNIMLQTMNTPIESLIGIIKSYIPNGYVETGWGDSLMVIPEILAKFNSDDKLSKFNSACDELVREIKALYS